jgi:protein-arginine kinase activator protein McsA
MIRKYSFTNHENGDDYVLTRNQILEICVQLNEKKRMEGSTKIIEINELDMLKKKLDIALESEEYEEAAKLRDKIKEIS